VADRPHIGHLLQRPARYFEVVLIERQHASGYTDLTVPHTAVFSVIDLAGTPIGVLARRAGVTKQAMSQVVEDLVAKGYAERREDPNDRRSRLVILTEKGLQAIRSARRHIQDIERDYSRELGSEQFETLCDLLRKIQPPPS
jgi:MarR family transcriptional regulator, temperature-dependent positive regulator of motility